MRLGVVFSPDGRANARYRAILPLQEMQRRGHSVVWPSEGSVEAILQTRPPKWDAVHIFQFVAPEHLVAVERLRAHGVAVVWDTDDDISTIPRASPAFRRLGGRRKIKQHAQRSFEIARTAHLMTTPSRHLAESYANAGAQRAVVIENHLADGDIGRRRRRHAGIVIGCTAGFEHGPDLKHHRITDVLRALLRAHPDVRVISIGLRLDLDGARYVYRPRVAADELIAYESEFDIGIAPLADTPLNRARSNVKLKEYAAAGATWLASPVGPYIGMGEEQGGDLVPDGQWVSALEALIRDPRLRAERMRRATAWAQQQTIRRAGGLWERAFRDAVLRARRS